MRYRVIVTVDVQAESPRAAERRALEAIVSDVSGGTRRVIDVRTGVHDDLVGLEDVVERTGMSPEMIERAIANGRFPAPIEGRWRSGEVEELMRSLGTAEELALEDDE